MDLDELDSEILRCLYLASATADLEAAQELRARADRLNIIAKSIEPKQPPILGMQPSVARVSDIRRAFARAVINL
ncbi:hypothetical protein ACFOKI_07760 [Sphingomonas qilianensis]|uniref:Uncharacterized protein n=1 Tax=Sphingomonas qilianensis TaxID=1736690 RepID=A0ABU9XWS2_9SPHN